VTRYRAYPPGSERYVKTFQHLSRPAPERGSTGVHEAGFRDYEADYLATERAVPTMTVVDDTFTENRDLMKAFIGDAKAWLAARG